MHSSVSGDLDELANEVSQLRSKDVVQEKKLYTVGTRLWFQPPFYIGGILGLRFLFSERRGIPRCTSIWNSQVLIFPWAQEFVWKVKTRNSNSPVIFFFFFSDQKKKNPMYLALDSADMSLDSEQAMFQTY